MNLTKPSTPYKRTSPEWQEYAYALASTFNLHRKHISAKLGISVYTLDTHSEVLARIQEGWCDFAAAAMGELVRFAFDDPANYDDPVERAQVRSAKLDATKTLNKIVEHREEMLQTKEEGEANRKVLRDLTPEALQAELRKHLK